jgi:hypothetical protein
VLAEGQQLQKRKQSSTWSCRRGTVAIAFTWGTEDPGSNPARV